MANILPVSDLRNYNEVLKNCRARDRVSKPKRDGAAKEAELSEEAQDFSSEG